mmetsp:Transcript_4426/g.11490  ORF Transcript_4426/g.11490 Transcript_4426/m.11490 type:complete len:89 (-) Transcript_4426:13-279(-)
MPNPQRSRASLTNKEEEEEEGDSDAAQMIRSKMFSSKGCDAGEEVGDGVGVGERQWERRSASRYGLGRGRRCCFPSPIAHRQPSPRLC